MPVTIKSADHPARKWTSTNEVHSAESLLKESCPAEYRKCKTIIRTSFGKFTSDLPLHPSNNGFVRAVIAAYCNHHHLTLRPEDIWFAILTQLKLYINAHAEELRSFFVAHEGQKELSVYDVGNIDTADFGAMARQMTKLMSDNVVDPELQPWIMPAFSTTTENDKVVASVIMMGALQKFFTYEFVLMCGIPSVTLLGIRADWEEILHRLEKLPNLGAEATQFCNLLKPVLTRFVRSFDCPDSLETKDFWQKIADQSPYGSGSTYLSGWITAFCFWDEDGKSMYAPNGELPPGPVNSHSRGRSLGCCLDDTLYHRLNMSKIPSGHCSVPVKLDDNGTLYETIMLAGSMGISARSTGEPLGDTNTHASLTNCHVDPSGRWVPNEHPPGARQAEPELDSLQPESGWFMFEKLEESEIKDGERREFDLYGRDGMSVLEKNRAMRGPPPKSKRTKRGLGKFSISHLFH